MQGVQEADSAAEAIRSWAVESDPSLKPLQAATSKELSEIQEKFQEFMAGSFYSQMVKSLRAGQGKPAYFHGGQAEEIFQSQMDQIVSTNLAKSHGTEFAEPMFRAYMQQRGAAVPESPARIDVSV